jgi:cytochrome c553
MSAQYLYKYKQLQDYASGARPHAVMSPIAKAMSEAEPRDVSAYYAAIEDAPYFPPPQVEPQVLRQGAALVAVGSEEKEVQACANCHSPAGRGVPAPSFPYLAGQYAQYIEQQLALFKQGQRHNDPLGVMRDMASRLSEDEVRAISLYFQSVRPSRTMHAAEPQGGEGGPRG